MTGTGFMKCMPITRSGRFVCAPMRVIEMELVLLARIAPGGRDPIQVGEDAELEIVFSVAASTTTVALPTAPRSVLVGNTA